MGEHIPRRGWRGNGCCLGIRAHLESRLGHLGGAIGRTVPGLRESSFTETLQIGIVVRDLEPTMQASVVHGGPVRGRLLRRDVRAPTRREREKSDHVC